MQKKNIFIRLSGIALIGALLLVCIINQIKIESLMIAILTIILFLVCSIFPVLAIFCDGKKNEKVFICFMYLRMFVGSYQLGFGCTLI